MNEAYLLTVSLKPERPANRRQYPFSIPAIRKLGTLRFDPRVTFFIGENGSGKSTLVEAIAVALGFNPEGGSRNFNFATRASHSELHRHLRIARGTTRPRDGYFLRAESFYNVASEVDRIGVEDSYGGRSLHAQSHGESFINLLNHRFGGEGLYLLDEPEAALSPSRQLACLRIIHELVERKTQFVIATHSPILMAYPGATIYQLDGKGIHPIAYEETEHYEVTRLFFAERERLLRELFAGE